MEKLKIHFLKELVKKEKELLRASRNYVFTIKYTRNGTHHSYQFVTAIDNINNINSKIADSCTLLGCDAVIDSITLDGIKDE